MSKWWMIRAGDHNEVIPVWKDKKMVGQNWGIQNISIDWHIRSSAQAGMRRIIKRFLKK